MSKVAAVVAVLVGFALGVGAGWLAFSDGAGVRAPAR